MEEVRAFKDDKGELHPTRLDAATADLIAAFGEERRKLVRKHNVDLPEVAVLYFARLLAENQNERIGIRMAIERFDEDRCGPLSGSLGPTYSPSR